MGSTKRSRFWVLPVPALHQGVCARREALREICLKAGLVFQNFNLFPRFSVIRNITEAQIRVLRRSRAEADKQAAAVIDNPRKERTRTFPARLTRN